MRISERREKKKTKIRIAAVLFWLAVWQTVSILYPLPLFLPGPVTVLQRLLQLCMTRTFWMAVLSSAARILGGYAAGAVLGLIAAAAAAKCEATGILLEPLIAAVRSVPVVSLIILLLISFSSEYLAFVIVLLIVFPVFYDAFSAGFSAEDKALTEMFGLYRVPAGTRARYFVIPSIAPFLLSAGDTAAGLAWKAGAAAEVIGMPARSLGTNLQQAKTYLDTPDLFAWTLVIVALSALTAHLHRKGWAVLMCRLAGIRPDGTGESLPDGPQEKRD